MELTPKRLYWAAIILAGLSMTSYYNAHTYQWLYAAGIGCAILMGYCISKLSGFAYQVVEMTDLLENVVDANEELQHLEEHNSLLRAYVVAGNLSEAQRIATWIDENLADKEDDDDVTDIEFVEAA